MTSSSSLSVSVFLFKTLVILALSVLALFVGVSRTHAATTDATSQTTLQGTLITSGGATAINTGDVVYLVDIANKIPNHELQLYFGWTVNVRGTLQGNTLTDLRYFKVIDKAVLYETISPDLVPSNPPAPAPAPEKKPQQLSGELDVKLSKPLLTTISFASHIAPPQLNQIPLNNVEELNLTNFQGYQTTVEGEFIAGVVGPEFNVKRIWVKGNELTIPTA